MSFPFSCQLHGRSAAFELAATHRVGDFDSVPVDALSIMTLVEANRFPQQLALEVNTSLTLTLTLTLTLILNPNPKP